MATALPVQSVSPWREVCGINPVPPRKQARRQGEMIPLMAGRNADSLAFGNRFFPAHGPRSCRGNLSNSKFCRPRIGLAGRRTSRADCGILPKDPGRGMDGEGSVAILIAGRARLAQFGRVAPLVGILRLMDGKPGARPELPHP